MFERRRAVKILSCNVPERLATAHETLHDHYECIFSIRIHDACSYLDHKPDVIVSNLYFGQGRIFEFFDYVRAHPVGKQIPIIIVNSTGKLKPAIRETVHIALSAYNVTEFVDFYDIEHELSHDAAVKEVLLTIDRILDKHNKDLQMPR